MNKRNALSTTVNRPVPAAPARQVTAASRSPQLQQFLSGGNADSATAPAPTGLLAPGMRLMGLLSFGKKSDIDRRHVLAAVVVGVF